MRWGLGMLLIGLVCGCAISPKEYKKIHPEPITTGKAKEMIKENTTYGIVNSIFGAVAGLVAIGVYIEMSDDYHDSDNYKNKSLDPALAESKKQTYLSLSRAAEKEGDNALDQVFLLTLITGCFINSATNAFKACREWEDELSRRPRVDPTLIYAWRIDKDASLRLDYNFVNLTNDPSFQKGLYLKLGVGF